MSVLSKNFITLVLSVVLSGCASSYMGSLSSDQRMIYSTPAAVPLPPGEGEALVYFIRRGSLEYGWALLVVIYDEDNFAGFVPSNKMLPHYATAGKHLFMAYCNASGAKPVARFIQADLLEGKIYYIVIWPDTMSFSGGFKLIPIQQNNYIFKTYCEWAKNAQIVSNNASAYEWAEQNRNQVLETKARCMKKWNTKPDDKKPTIRPEYNLEIEHKGMEKWQ